MSNRVKIKIDNLAFKKKEFPIKYISKRIKRDPDGKAVETHGRPETEDIMEVRIQTVYKPFVLIEGNWYPEKEAWNLFGRKKIVKALKKYVNKSKDRDELRRKLGKR